MRGYVRRYKQSEFGMSLAAEQLLARYLPEDYSRRDPEGFNLLKEGINSLTVESYEYTSEAINAMDYDSQLDSIDLPTMVIAGELDVPTSPSRMTMYRDRIRGAKWGIVEGAAHLPNFENPKAFNRLLIKFIEGL